MNDEIREILEQLEWYRKIGKKDVYYPECVLSNKKAYILLDYITNLQQENDDYKSRVEKVIKLINKRKDEIDELLWVEMTTKDYFAEYDDLLNILQNGSDGE